MPERKEAITEELFREAYGYQEERKKPWRKVMKEMLLSKQRALELIPVAVWIRQYNFRKDLLRDLIAGLTVAIMHIPHGLAYAPLGGVDPIVGFYMAVFPVIVYFFLGTSHHVSIGTFAVVCSMIGDVVHNHLHVRRGHHNVTIDRLEALEVSSATCLLVGMWQACLGLLQFGTLAVIMSESLVSGFTAGAAVHVFTYQLPNLTGIKSDRQAGLFKLIYLYRSFFVNITKVNFVTLGLSLSSIFILLFCNLYVKKVLKKKFPNFKVHLPTELFLVLLGIVLSYALNLSGNYNVRVVGQLPTGLPEVMVPGSKCFLKLVGESLVVAIVSLAINLSLAKIFAKKGLYTVRCNQEFFAYGMANIFASFFRCMPSAASLSRTTIQFTIGGKTQIASLVSAAVILLVLIFAGPVFEPVPYCVLSSIVVVTLMGLLSQVLDFPSIWRQSYWNGIVWMGTFITVILGNLEFGLIVGLFLCLLSIAFKAHSYGVTVMGRVPNTNIYLPLEKYSSTREVPNILILRLSGNLNFVNSFSIEKRIMKPFEASRDPKGEDPHPQHVILDMSCVSEVDPALVYMVKDYQKFLQINNCDLYLTDCNASVYKSLGICNLYQTFPKDHVLATVADAVDYLNFLDRSTK